MTIQQIDTAKDAILHQLRTEHLAKGVRLTRADKIDMGRQLRQLDCLRADLEAIKLS